MNQLEYQGRNAHTPRSVCTIISISLLILAWGSSITGYVRVARLNWAGSDPDPSIAQRFSNDARQSRVFLPPEIVAATLGFAAVTTAVGAVLRHERKIPAVVVLVLSLGCFAWFVFICVVKSAFSA